jgi:photosystem II stability/assembly factor-like uncharacterized protein
MLHKRNKTSLMILLSAKIYKCLLIASGFLLLQQSYAQIKPGSAGERLKGLEKKILLEQSSLVKDVKFRNIGPTIMSGRVVDIEVNPQNPNEFYVAYATGGLWHTLNNGQSFIPIFDNENTITIGDIAINWSNKIIWVGTGEVNSSRSSYAGIGVFKSNNNGKSWQYLGLPESHHIGKIQLHPTNVNIAWVAVLGHLYSANKERGIYKTTDGGNTWKQTLFTDNNTGAVEMDINTANPNELYAAMWYKTRTAFNFEESGKSSGLYKSTNGGESWQKINTAASGLPDGNNVGRMGVAVYTKNPQVVYVVVDNQDAMPDTTNKNTPDTLYKLADFKNLTIEQFAALDDARLNKFLRASRMPAKYTAASVKALVKTGKVKPTALYDYLYVNDGFQNKSIIGCEVYRSDDAGKTWKKTNEKPIYIFSTYGYYFGKIFVSPVDDKKVFITGIQTQLSTDGGKNFKTIDKANVHSDHHALWINPANDNHIINGNDGGLNISYDNGENWFKANTPPVAQYYNITVDNAKPYNVYGGLQDNGSWYGPSANKESLNWLDEGEYAFKRMNGGDGMQAQVDTRDNSTVYSGSQFGAYQRINLQTKERKFVRPMHELGEMPLRFNWQTPILLSTHNQDVLYVGSNRFHRSLNKGDTLVAISNDLTNGAKTGDVPFGTLATISESPLKFGLLYAGSDDGNIHLSKDGGNSWQLLSLSKGYSVGRGKTKNTTVPAGMYVSRVLASAYKESRVYATLNGYRNDNFMPYVFVSDDYGSTWKQIGTALPAEPVNVIKEDLKSDSILYVGTDGGVYVSIDAGNSFMAFTNGLPRAVPVHDIALHKGENEIILGTHGRSLYIAKLDEVQKLLTDKELYNKKKAASDKALVIAGGVAFTNVYNNVLDVDCPPVNKKKKNKK